MIWTVSSSSRRMQALAAHWQHKANNNSSQSPMAGFHSPRPRGLCLSFARKAGEWQKPCRQSCPFSGRCKQTLHSRWLLVCFFHISPLLYSVSSALKNWTTAKIGLPKIVEIGGQDKNSMQEECHSESPHLRPSKRMKRSAVCEWAACRRGC